MNSLITGLHKRNEETRDEKLIIRCTRLFKTTIYRQKEKKTKGPKDRKCRDGNSNWREALHTACVRENQFFK